MYKCVGTVDVAWEKHPAKAKRRKGARPTDGARGSIYKDVYPPSTTNVRYRSPLRLKFEPVPLSSRDKQLVFPHAEAGDGIFIHPN